MSDVKISRFQDRLLFARWSYLSINDITKLISRISVYESLSLNINIFYIYTLIFDYIYDILIQV